MSVANTREALLFGSDDATRTMLRFLLGECHCAAIERCSIAADGPWPTRAVALVVVIADGYSEDGPQLVACLRQRGYRAPTLLLTRHVDLDARRRAAALGVSDIVHLPASPRFLLERLRAALNDTEPAPLEAPLRGTVRAGGLVLDTRTGEVSDGRGWTMYLTHREAAVLSILMMCPGRVLGRQDILDYVWGQGYEGDGSSLEVYVSRVRTKLGREPNGQTYVHTARGQGYYFDARSVIRAIAGPQSFGRLVLLLDDQSGAITASAAALCEAGYVVARCRESDMAMTAAQIRPAAIVMHGCAEATDLATRRLRAHVVMRDVPLFVIGDVDAPDDEAGVVHFSEPLDGHALVRRIEQFEQQPRREAMRTERAALARSDSS